MTKEFENVIYCFAEHVKLPVENSTAKFNPLVVTARTQLRRMVFVFWTPEKIGFLPEEMTTSPIKPNDFFKLEIVNYKKAKSEYESGRDIALQGNHESSFSYSLISKSDVPLDIIGQIYKDRSKQTENAKKYLVSDTWNDKKVKEFVKTTIAKNPKFIEYPAALSHHHTYKGGLLVHTYEVAYLSQKITEAVEELNPDIKGFDKDALKCAAWLHDIGKLEVYEEKDDVYIPSLCKWADATNKGTSSKDNTASHITRSYEIFKNNVKEYEFEDEFVEKVGHCILAHHGRKEWDSPVEPKCLEAFILATADKISADASKQE